MVDQDLCRIPIAIVGMACRLPGADNLDQYWQMLINGRSAVVEMPRDRFDEAMYFDPREGVVGKTYSKLCAIINSREFDRSRCPISSELAASVDNVHLLMCDVAGSALRHAGYDPFNLALRNAGVYIGHAQGSTLGGDQTYATLIDEAAEFLRETPQFQQLPVEVQQRVIHDLIARVRSKLPERTTTSPDVAASLVAGTISKAFGLNGPYLAINSACASSLQAMLLGARALQLGRIDMAIVGGASDCKSDSLVLFSHARAMSATGSRPFDSGANGLIVGEGYVAVVMKRLDRALADGDRVWAVVRGIGVSSDGRGKSLWAPRKEGQVKAMERAYRGGLDMADIEYIEAHATATQLGDATELNTLTELFVRHFPPGKKIPITSVKANIGHTLETAGIAGVVKTVLAMHHETVPPAINIRQLNPQIDWQNAPIFVPTAPVAWPKRADGKPRRAGVNAFGIGGLNMHVALDEFNESSRTLVAGAAPATQPTVSTKDEAIAVIGLGCVLPGASNPNAFWEMLVSGRDPKIPVPKDRWDTEVALRSSDQRRLEGKSLLGGFITDFVYDWKRHKLPPKQIAQADPLQFMLLDAADQAMQDAGYHQREFARENVGVVVGTEFGGDFAFQLQMGLRLPELEQHIERLLVEQGVSAEEARAAASSYHDKLLDRWPALIDETGSFSTSSLASRIGKTWNLMGGAAAIDAGHTSGLAALSISTDMLLAHDCDLMICAAGQRRMALPEYEMLANNNTLAEGTLRSPLDAQAQGLVPGEGVVVLLLKRLADAQRDGDRVHAILHKVEAAHDAAQPELALQLAIDRTARDRDISLSDVACLEIDVPDVPRGADRALQAVGNAYGKQGRRAALLVSSPVGQFGHMQGASSLVSLLKAILESNAGEFPGTIGLQHPAASFVQRPELMQAPSAPTAIQLTTQDGARMAAVAAASRGLAYHAVLESGNRVAVMPTITALTPGAQIMEPSAMDAATTNGTAMTAAASSRIAELEKFLVNFVVEQTGYPPEVIELDANLEADLGIDSIKKAQMFGELQEYFDVAPTGNLTLNDFPTLRHIVNFLAGAPTKESAPAAISEPTVSTAQPVAPVTSPSVMPAAPVVAPVAPLATNQPVAAPVAPQTAAVETGGMDVAELENFLINFVVEQTGYPPEVVELDANLEADLGIDSIKKAQMFGELQEYFDVAPTGNLTLNDFPTLRHIVNFLAKVPTTAAAPVASIPTVSPAPAPAPLAPMEASAVMTSAPPSTPVASAPAPAPMVATQTTSLWRIYRFGAADRIALKQQIERAAQDSQAWETSSRRTFTKQDRFRVAIVADGPATLSTRLAMAAKQIDQPAAQTVLEQNGIFVREAVPATRIAFLFSGQGSQYPGMLRQVVQDVPESAAELQRIDAAMTRLRHPSWAQLIAEESSLLGKDVWATQISMLLADSLMLAALRSRGIEPDVVAGHSYGEYPALLAAGAWDLEQAVRVTGRRCDSIESCPTARGTMLATTAPPETVEQLARQVSGAVHVANLNAPDQTVVGGTAAALAELDGLLKANKFDSRLLPVPSPFHTPLMREAADKFAAHLSQETFQPPRVATYSVATNELVRTADEIRTNLVAHLITPVRYAELIRKLATEAPTVFVEVGPQQALTRLNRRILPAEQFTGIACDNPLNPGVEQLVRVQALLECSGALDRHLQPQAIANISSRVVKPAPRSVGEIWHFDATARRREKRRQAAGQGNAAPAMPRPAQAPVVTAPVTAPAPAPVALQPAPPPKQISVAAVTPPPVASPPPPRVAPAPVAQSVAQAIASSMPVTPAPQANAVVATGPSTDVSELEKFLVNFVVEQTGYPPEVVDLDANLEADLGIDSIKKAQMFGELQEYFDVAPTGNLTLNDFPTLRHIVNFLAASPRKEGAADAAVEQFASTNPPNVTVGGNGTYSHGNGAAPKPESVPQPTTTGGIDVLHLAGSSYQMGQQHGSRKGDVIRAALRRIADLTDGDYSELPIPAESWNNPQVYFSQEELAELQGMSEMVDVPLGNLAALNLTLRNSLTVPGETLDTSCNESTAAGVAASLMNKLILPTPFRETLCPIVVTRPGSDGAVRSEVSFAGLVGRLSEIRPQPPDNGKHVSAATAVTSPASRAVAKSGMIEEGDAETEPQAAFVAGPSAEAAVTPLADLTDLLDSEIERSDFQRYVMRLSPMPWESQPAEFPIWKGAAAILGENPVADSLESRLKSSGAKVIRLRESSSLEGAIAEMEEVHRREGIAHLFVTSTRDGESIDRIVPEQWDQLFQKRNLIPYFLCQRWLTLAGDAERLNDCSVIAVTDLGGDLGFSGNVESPESGFLTGLMKSLVIEYRIMRGFPQFIAKAIDGPQSDSPEEFAANICRELAHGSKDYELAFVNGRRYLQVALPEPARVVPDVTSAPSGVWVLTGGARGITALCGLELGRRFGVKLHLIGTSPIDAIEPSWRDLNDAQTAELRTRIILEARQKGQRPNDAWGVVAKKIEIDRNMRAFTDAGISATYHACDVSDRAALAVVLDRIRAVDGPISGILHGAAIDQSCRFEKKSTSIAMASFGAKINGAYNLMMLTRRDPVRHFIGFGSISGRLGSNGQTDYAAGCDLICKLAGWYHKLRPECRAIGIHWHGWDEVGMATRPEAQAVLKASKLRLMPSSIGVRHFLREIFSRTDETEVLMTDKDFHQRYYEGDIAAIERRDDLIGQPGSTLVVDRPTTESNEIARRFVMRMADAPLSGAAEVVALPSSVFLLGDNADTDALAAHLESRNVKVTRLPMTDDPDATGAALEQAWAATPARCLILMSGRDSEAARVNDPAVARRRSQRGVYVPYWVTRRWVNLLGQQTETEPATIVAVTSLGGDFGFESDVPVPEGGALTGLLKSIYVEDARTDHARFRVKVIDLPANEPSVQLADSICREMTSGRPEVEVAWTGGQRRMVVTRREPIASSAPSDSQSGMIARGGNWVITGGGRGVSAAMSLELARRYQLRLHLLGASPAPDPKAAWHHCTDEELKKIKAGIVRKATLEGRSPNDDWNRVWKDREIQQSLDKFAAACVQVTYHRCDVSDWNDLSRVLVEIRAAEGPIDGILHGAGYARPARFGAELKADVWKTIAPKVDGTLALMHLTKQDPVRTFITFGSLSGRFGGNGLSEYAAANDMLAKLCGWYRHFRPECRAVCLEWQSWDQIGMATKSDSLDINRTRFKIQFISPEEGTAHFLRELNANTSDSEVLLTDGYFQREFYPYEMEQSAATATAASSTSSSTADLPLVPRWESDENGGGTAHVLFDPRRDPFLTQHLFRQKPFLPAVIGIELLAEAARSAMGSGFPNALCEVRIPNGLMFHTDDPLAARVAVGRSEQGLKCRLLTELRDRQGRLVNANRLQVEGFAAPAGPVQPIIAEAAAAPSEGWVAHPYLDDAAIYHGPPFRCLREILLQHDGGWGKLIATPLADMAGARDEAGWSISPGVLDSCLVACGAFLWMQFSGAFEVPYGFQRLTWTRRPRNGETCTVRFTFRERGPKHSRFDFTLFGDDHQPILQAIGYQTIRVGGANG